MTIAYPRPWIWYIHSYRRILGAPGTLELKTEGSGDLIWCLLHSTDTSTTKQSTATTSWISYYSVFVSERKGAKNCSGSGDSRSLGLRKSLTPRLERGGEDIDDAGVRLRREGGEG